MSSTTQREHDSSRATTEPNDHLGPSNRSDDKDMSVLWVKHFGSSAAQPETNSITPYNVQSLDVEGSSAPLPPWESAPVSMSSQGSSIIDDSASATELVPLSANAFPAHHVHGTSQNPDAATVSRFVSIVSAIGGGPTYKAPLSERDAWFVYDVRTAMQNETGPTAPRVVDPRQAAARYLELQGELDRFTAEVLIPRSVSLSPSQSRGSGTNLDLEDLIRRTRAIGAGNVDVQTAVVMDREMRAAFEGASQDTDGRNGE